MLGLEKINFKLMRDLSLKQRGTLCIGMWRFKCVGYEFATSRLDYKSGTANYPAYRDPVMTHNYVSSDY